MKTIALVAALAYASFINVDANVINDEAASIYTAYNYLARYGIPEAERIRKIEENSASRIVGGLPAGVGQYPYQIGVISDIVGQTGRGVCGGSLISANRAMTAAHCWYDGVNQAWQVEAVLGSNFIFYGGQRLLTSAVVVHPSWFPLLIRNDIAIIYLPTPVAFSNVIQPIALPSGDELLEDFAGEKGIASGYGINYDGQNSLPTDQEMHHVALNIITNDNCRRILAVIQDSNICTSGLGGVSTCSGDSGGPLAVTRKGRTIQVGITSFGLVFGCEKHLPAAFARVTSFISFIHQHL